MADPATDGRTLADKLDHLFRSVHPRGRGEYTYAEVAKAIEDRGGPTVSATYIWQLRKGRRDNPTKRHLEASLRRSPVAVTPLDSASARPIRPRSRPTAASGGPAMVTSGAVALPCARWTRPPAEISVIGSSPHRSSTVRFLRCGSTVGFRNSNVMPRPGSTREPSRRGDPGAQPWRRPEPARRHPDVDTPRRPKRKASVRPLIVVVPHGWHPPLSECVRVGRLGRRLDDLDAIGGRRCRRHG